MPDTAPQEQQNDAPAAGWWVETDIEVDTKKGRMTVRGLTHPRVPGLAVTPCSRQFGAWTVTHIGTGKKVGGEYERVSNACLCLVTLGYCCDWTLDATGIVEYLRDHGDEPANVPGCTTTGGGETRSTCKRELVASYQRDFLFDEFPWEDESPQGRANELLLGLPSPMETADNACDTTQSPLSSPPASDLAAARERLTRIREHYKLAAQHERMTIAHYADEDIRREAEIDLREAEANVQALDVALSSLGDGDDSARLAFIERACLSVDYCWTSANEPGWWQVYQGGHPVPPNGDTYATIREAIDAARACDAAARTAPGGASNG